MNLVKQNKFVESENKFVNTKSDYIQTYTCIKYLLK